MKKITFYYGPKSDFINIIQKTPTFSTVSKLAIQSDKKMREHVFKIQGRNGNKPEAAESKIKIETVVAFSEQYASLSDSAVQSFSSFIGMYDIDKLYLQNPPMQILAQFSASECPIEIIKYHCRSVDEDVIRAVNAEYENNIIGQEKALHSLLVSLYPLCSAARTKPVVLLFYGPTGVGKSETAQFLSRIMGQKLFRRQFSMFHSSEFASYLFGGRHTQSSLAKDLMERESNVILFDEFDKPSPVFHSAFYQLFDEGVYEDRNYHADAERAVIICTSNYASAAEAKEKLGAPLFARFDAVIEFSPLSDESMMKVMVKECSKVIDGLDPLTQAAVSEKDVITSIAPRIGEAGNVRRLNKMVRDAVSEILLDKMLK